MASEGETQSDNAAKPHRCELCPKSFKVTRSLKAHYMKGHGLAEGHDLVRSVPKSPKKPCKRCGKQVSNPWSHEKSCPAVKRKKAAEVAGTTSGEPSPTKAATAPSSSGSASQSQGEKEKAAPAFVIKSGRRLSDAEFVQLYEKWMRSGRGGFAGAKTVEDYTRHMKEFMRLQGNAKPGFKARHWIAFKSQNFTPLCSVGDWVPRGDGQSTANKKICSYKHLLALIRSTLVSKGAGCEDFAHRGALLEERHREASSFARRWRSGEFEKARGASAKRKQPTIDTHGWQRLMKAYMRSERRAMALDAFTGECYYYYYYYY